MSATTATLWSLGRPGSLPDRIFDALRRGLNGRLARYLHARVARSRGGPVTTLEPGSGPGFCSSLLAGTPGVARAVVLDLDRDALRAAVAGATSAARVQGDLYRLPFATGTFDLVFNSSTLEHLDAFDEALGEMIRVTRPRGHVFVGVPYRYGPFVPFTLVPPRHPASLWMGRLYSRRALLAACRRVGVSVEDVRFYFFGCFVGVLLRRDGDAR